MYMKIVLHRGMWGKVYVDGVNVQQFRDGVGLGWGCMFPLVSLLFRDVCDP